MTERMEEINSQHNSLLKLVSSLGHKKYRDETGMFVFEGIRLFEEAVKAGYEITTVIGTHHAYNQPRVQKLLNHWQQPQCRMVVVPEALYAKVSDTEQPQGLMGVARQKHTLLQDLDTGKKALIMILDGVQDPGNVGALIRVADAAGCQAVVLTTGCANVYGSKVVRASMGSLFHLPVIQSINPVELADWLRLREIALLGTTLTDAQEYVECDFTCSVAIAFGNEGAGMSEQLLQYTKKRLYIPIYGQAESLNVATAAAVIFYEAARQRRMNL